MSELVKVLEAVSFAASRHRNQRRKGADRSPYVNHPIEVARELAATGGVGDVDVLLAALLHDTVEDTGTSPGELEERFGAAVRRLVEEVSDDKSLPKAERKRLQVERAAALSPGAKLIKLADKICNVREVTLNPPLDWSSARRSEYFDWAEAVVARLRGTNEALERAFDATLEMGRSLVR
jgi:guanosine-3',5'-bis(diphosphate) 3'-pyrophosphohydrolase